MRTLVVPLVVSLLMTAGCEPRSSGEVADQSDTTTTPSIVATSTGNIVATLTEWEVALTQDTIAAGQITVQVMNRGTEYHRLEIEGGGSEWVSDSLQGNGEQSMQVQLAPGTYEVYCPIVGSHGVHRELGMLDTLVVR